MGLCCWRATLLTYANGEVGKYTLEIRGEELYMIDDRFFRTTSGEYAPAVLLVVAKVRGFF